MLFLGKTRLHTMACHVLCLICLPSLVAQERPSAIIQLHPLQRSQDEGQPTKEPAAAKGAGQEIALRPVSNRQPGAPSQLLARLNKTQDLAVPEPLRLDAGVSQQTNEVYGSESPSDKNGSDPRPELTPMLTRELTNRVTIVSTSPSDLGGLLPEPEPRTVDETRALPDGVARGASFKCIHWKPSCICHFPLYFEDAMLERHGHTRFGTLQPLASGAKFFTTISLLPYLKTLQPACEPSYVLGHYRPGTCAPLLRDNIPYDKRAAAVETLGAAAFFWAMPL